MRFRRLLVAVVLGLVLVVLVRPGGRGDRRVDSYFAAMLADLRALAQAQNDYYARHARFAPAVDSLPFVVSADVVVEIIRADARGWAANVTHQRIETHCRYTDGVPPGPPPPVRELKAGCENVP